MRTYNTVAECLEAIEKKAFFMEEIYQNNFNLLLAASNYITVLFCTFIAVPIAVMAILNPIFGMYSSDRWLFGKIALALIPIVFMHSAIEQAVRNQFINSHAERLNLMVADEMAHIANIEYYTKEERDKIYNDFIKPLLVKNITANKGKNSK